MGRVLSKRRKTCGGYNGRFRACSGCSAGTIAGATVSWDTASAADDQSPSCGLAEFWTDREREFRRNYADNGDRKSALARAAARASDFRITALLDKGAFGSVALTTHTGTGAVYATKMIAKKKISKKADLVKRVYNEKRIMESINFPFVIRLEHFYQDNSYLYFVMPFACGGNLFTYIQRHGTMADDMARFYVAEVLLAIEYLHKLELVHRDIKPENVLIDVNGHAQLADFGFCRRVTGRTFSFCGTPEYIAPEIIAGQGYGKSVDYWSLGVLLFELQAGRSPFLHHDDATMYRNIMQCKYSCPYGFTGDLMHLLRGLLRVDVTRRYGNMANGVWTIKRHRWMRPVDWCALFNKQVAVPYVPAVADDQDVSHFKALKERVFVESSQDWYGDMFQNF